MRRRIVLITVAIATLVVVAFAVPLGALVASVARDRALSAAERDAAALAPVLAVTSDPELIGAAVGATATGADGRLTVVLADGTVVGGPGPLDRAAVQVARDQRRSFLTDDGGRTSLWIPVVGPDGAVAVVRAEVPDGLARRGVLRAWGALAAVAVALVAAAAFVADRLARAMVREADALGATARRLAGGDPGARAAPGVIPELADAARALNLLADRIDELRAAERERVADLSHRLRTPLTALRLAAERAGDPELIGAVDELDGHVDAVIRAARRPLHPSPVGARCDAASVVRERAGFWGALAEDDGRAWACEAPPGPVPVGVLAEELRDAVDALIGNVFAHTPEGTAYRVALEVDGSAATVVVEDAGPGIADPEAALRRGRSGAGSTGLGLAIAREVAESAGGSLTVGTGSLGGARVELRFPRPG